MGIALPRAGVLPVTGLAGRSGHYEGAGGISLPRIACCGANELMGKSFYDANRAAVPEVYWLAIPSATNGDACESVIQGLSMSTKLSKCN